MPNDAGIRIEQAPAPKTPRITFQRALNRRADGAATSTAANSVRSGQKSRCPLEQKPIVAAPSQSRTITAAALPRSNQIEAMLFD
jgi:hypothetical protein